MATKHFINDPVHLVSLALRILPMTNPKMELDEANKIVYLRQEYVPAKQRVAMISGGGSGHEPSFTSMVGPGLLNAAIAGNVFASPNAEQVRKAIMRSWRRCQRDKGQEARDGSQGVLAVIMNYTGDVLNFGVAVEKARTAGVNVEMVIVGDDVAVARSQAGKVGRRGFPGTIVVHKIAGALAAKGYGLGEVADMARLVANNIASISVSLDHVHIPGTGTDTAFGSTTHARLGNDIAEMGMGIHNEQGIDRVKVDLPDIVRRMLAQLLRQDDGERSFVDFGTNSAGILLLVNNLGGLSILELGAITMEIVTQLDLEYGYSPARVMNGSYMTSLNAPGFTITLLKLVDTGIEPSSMLDLWDSPCEANAWPSSTSQARQEGVSHGVVQNSELNGEVSTIPVSGLEVDLKLMDEMLRMGLSNIIKAEPQITRYDTIVGDGDCGICLKRGAEAALEQILHTPLSGDIIVDVANLVGAVERSMDGTSGALYGIFLNSLVSSLQSLAPGRMNAALWAVVLRKSCKTLAKYTPAGPGDRTVIDALYPFVEVLSRTGDVKQAALTSIDAANATKGLRPRLGRSVYVGGCDFKNIPDPGACGLAAFFAGLAGLDWDKGTYISDSKPVAHNLD